MKKPGGGRDTVLESRHVVGMFLGVVVLCGVFFTLGYVMGRTQQDSSVKAVSASAATARPADKTATPAPAPSSWDFVSGGNAKKSPGKLETPAKTTATGGPPPVITSTPIRTESAATKSPEKTLPVAKPSAATKKALTKAPVIPRGSVVLQIAALTREGDALALVEALQKKQFPAFLLTPTTGNLYRVQVGPYLDGKAADAAKKALEREGFKAITKR